MEYLIILLLIPIAQAMPVANSRMPLLDNLRAPLVAELDVTSVNMELKKYIDVNVEDQLNQTCYAKIQTVVQDSLLDLKSEMLKIYEGDFDGLQQRITSQFSSLETILRKEKEKLEQNLTIQNEEWKIELRKEHGELKSDIEEFKSNIAVSLLNLIAPDDCSDLMSTIYKSGVYLIQSKMFGAFNVCCDMDTDGGGWTVFQRRLNGKIDFSRDWNDYRDGFGDPQAEFWMGNSKLAWLTSKRQYELRINLEDFYGETAYAKYSTFSIGDESTKYQLMIDGYSGTAGDRLYFHNNQKFLTEDSYGNQFTSCGDKPSGGWWYYGCVYSDLNGLYLGNQSGYHGVCWDSWKGSKSLKTTSMMIRRKRT